MSNRKLYGDAKLIKELLGKMQLVEEAEGGWATVYKDASSGRFWMKYHTTAGEQSGGGYELLIRLPLPTTQKLVAVAIESPFEDEAVAAVMRLLEEEALEKKDFRHVLVNRLEEMNLESLPTEQKQRIRKVFTLTSLLDPTNKREVKGKTIEQLKEDAAYFENVSKRALILSDKL
ncbi:Imm27 family immunity protein [Pontibacter korlensis]|uniref:Uncharacterized protein n=1 Tax=Pontibacter korlensis TaxID=400092 RepID=A0A0E3ZBQ2_9BACT|nr:Imm27 family immunity protein [Pontibacter korlensis]AKD02134.1 hypothetical protein PKOR_02020 [Pontibacter korlensis]